MERLAHIIHALEAATHDPASSLHFTPVALRARADGWTPERQRLFVAALAALGHAGHAAAWVGMSEQTAARLRHREDASSFSRACAAAFSMAKRLRYEAARAQGTPGTKGAKGAEGPRRAEGSKAAKGFSPRGSSLSTNYEPSAPSPTRRFMPSRPPPR